MRNGKRSSNTSKNLMRGMVGVFSFCVYCSLFLCVFVYCKGKKETKGKERKGKKLYLSVKVI